MHRVAGGLGLGLGLALGIVLLVINPVALFTVAPAVVGGGSAFLWGRHTWVLIPAAVLVGLSGYMLMISGVGLVFFIPTILLVVAIAEGNRRPASASPETP